MRQTKLGLPVLLDLLYEGMLDDEAWSCALKSVSNYFGGSPLALFSVNPASNTLHRADLLRIDPAAMRAYEETWIHQDPRHAAGLVCPVGEPQTEAMLVDARALRRTAIYNEFLQRWEIPFFMATWIVREPQRGVIMSIQHDARRGQFGERERDAMRALVPHLRRILEVKDRLQHAQVTSEGLLEVSDRLPFGTLFLSRDLQIIEASAIASKLLAQRNGIHADDGVLGFAHRSDARAFAAMLLRSGILPTNLDCLHVQRSPPHAPLAILVVPLPTRQEPWLRVAARWMVLVFDPERGVDPDELLLRRALAISAAEASLARLLAMGMTMTDAARHLRITRNTARSQLKSIYSKTGVNSQAQLTRRVLMSSGMLGRFHPIG